MKQQHIGMSEEQIKQLEEWTMMRCRDIIFDSDDENNRLETSQLETKIIGKQSLLFIIDDGCGNTYGGYVSSRIEKCNTWIEDDHSFIFSLLSGQQSTEMKKFRIVNKEKAFYLYPKSSMYSFQIGIHISINKKGENDSCCHFNLLNSSEKKMKLNMERIIIPPKKNYCCSNESTYLFILI